MRRNTMLHILACALAAASVFGDLLSPAQAQDS
jgi:hypothetical protein